MARKRIRNTDQIKKAIPLILDQYPGEIKYVLFHCADDKRLRGRHKGTVHWKDGREVSFINFDFDNMKVLELESNGMSDGQENLS